MKTLKTKLLLAFFISGFFLFGLAGITEATTYFVKPASEGGSDGYTGLSDAQAWATIGKVNLQNFANGDVICLKRGSTFTDATLTLDGISVGRSGIVVQDYGAGNKPWINGNSVQPININHALVNLTLKNIDVSGSDTSGNRCLINNVNGIVIDGIDYDGHIGSSSYIRSNAMAVSRVDGDIEIKNCTIQNVMKDTFANTYSAWLVNDAHGIIMYYAGDENVKSSGTVSIHDNDIHHIYSDCLQIAGMNTTVNIYDNNLHDFGENAIDMKHSKYIDFYRNTISHNDYGAANGSGFYGPTAVVSGASANWETFLPSDNIVRENYFNNSKYTAIQTPGTNAIIKNNYINNYFMGVRIGNGGAKVYGNVFNLSSGKPTVEPYATRWIATMLSGTRITKSVNMYDNTFYMSSNDHLYGIAAQSSASANNIQLKNNIVQITRNDVSIYPLYIEDTDNTGNLPISEYNNFYGAHSNRVRIEETPGSWVTYNSTDQTAWRNAGHTGALFTNPNFTNPSAGDLTLKSTSSAIDKGADLGSPYNLGLNSASTWPNNVSTLNQNDYGNWEIGAYVHGDATLDICTSQSGTCCPVGQICQGGSSVSSFDCATICCVGGTCEAEITCGDGTCNGDETCSTCPADCEACPTFLPEQYIEAEDGELVSPMQIGNDATASGGQFIFTNTNEQGSVSFAFDIQQAGEYTIEALILSPDAAGNSFFVGLNDESSHGNDDYIYDTPESAEFIWDEVSLRGAGGDYIYSEFDPMVWDLTSGTHAFTFYGRETKTRLDKIILKKYNPSLPTDINSDNQVDLLDIQACVNVFMEIETDLEIVSRADVNEDEIVNVLDIQEVVNVILE